MFRRLAPFAFALLTLVALSFALERPRAARAQQVASQYTCTALLDGGSTNAVCGTFLANYQPFTTTCEVSVNSGDHSSAVATVNLLGSGDGVHYGTIADAGYAIAIVANGDGGFVSTTAGFAVSPTDPWLDYEILASGILQDAGTASTGRLTCQISVINSQTLHSVRPTGLKTATPVR